MALADAPPPHHGYIVQALRAAADEVERRLSRSTGLDPGQVAILMHLAVQQPRSIPDVATAVGHGYRWAQAGLAKLCRSAWSFGGRRIRPDSLSQMLARGSLTK